LFLPIQGGGNVGVLRTHDKRYRHRGQQVPELHFGVLNRDSGLSGELGDNGKDVQENVAVFHVRAEWRYIGDIQLDAGQ